MLLLLDSLLQEICHGQLASSCILGGPCSDRCYLWVSAGWTCLPCLLLTHHCCLLLLPRPPHWRPAGQALQLCHDLLLDSLLQESRLLPPAPGWVRTSTSRSCTGRSRAMLCAICSASGAGSIVSLPRCTALPGQPGLTRHAGWATKPSRDTSSTVSP